ncbi:hypothetical protein LTR60_000140 [Cryomyces antarcticus]|nr:hypothetical protein LTR60_000140 [Cryomyces antarcticus]
MISLQARTLANSPDKTAADIGAMQLPLLEGLKVYLETTRLLQADTSTMEKASNETEVTPLWARRLEARMEQLEKREDTRNDNPYNHNSTMADITSRNTPAGATFDLRGSRGLRPAAARAAPQYMERLKPVSKQTRQIRVTIDEADKDSMGSTMGAIIRARINEAVPATGVVAVNKNGTNGFMVVTKTREGCVLLGEDKEWAGKTFPTAKARRTTFPVLVHRIRVADVGEKGDETRRAFLRDIQTADQETMPGLTIDNVFWLARSNAAQKQYSSLVLAVTTPEDANNIMDNGIILGTLDALLSAITALA